jgi:hypothetical protein
MIPLRSNVTQAVLSALGDTQVSGGGLYTAAFQAPNLDRAYGEMFTRLKVMSAQRVQREGFYVLPAYTGTFVPSLAGLTNFGGPVEIRERGSATTYAVSAATPSSPSAGLLTLTVAAIPATIATGQIVDVYGLLGISDDVNDSWAITVNSTTSVSLNGCAASGTWTSGGQLVISTEQWSEVLDVRANTDNFPTSPNSALGLYCWQKGNVRFPICSTAREIRLIYNLSSSLPVATQTANDTMGVDDCLNFLAARTAQYCAESKGNAKAPILQQQADYFLGLMLQDAGKQMQSSEPIVMPPFRSHRRGLPIIW